MRDKGWAGGEERAHPPRELINFTSAIPKVAPAADQPTNPSWPLVLLSLTLPAPYPPQFHKYFGD